MRTFTQYKQEYLKEDSQATGTQRQSDAQANATAGGGGSGKETEGQKDTGKSQKIGQFIKNKKAAAVKELEKNPIKTVMTPLLAIGGNSWLNKNKGKLDFFAHDPNTNPTYKKAWDKFLEDPNQTNADALASVGISYWKKVGAETEKAFATFSKGSEENKNQQQSPNPQKEEEGS